MDLRSQVIRLAHAQPHLREKLLPLVDMGMNRLAAIKIPNGIHPVFDKNVMAIPATWGSHGEIKVMSAARSIGPLYEKAINGVAFIVDPNGVISRIDRNLLQRELVSHIQDWYGERDAMLQEYFQDDPDGNKQLDKSSRELEAIEKLHVRILDITSPTTGRRGLKLIFSPTAQELSRA